MRYENNQTWPDPDPVVCCPYDFRFLLLILFCTKLSILLHFYVTIATCSVNTLFHVDFPPMDVPFFINV